MNFKKGTRTENHAVAPPLWTIVGEAEAAREEHHRHLTWTNLLNHVDEIHLECNVVDTPHKDLVQGSHKVFMSAMAVVEESGIVRNPPVLPLTVVHTEEIVKSNKHHLAAIRVAVVGESEGNGDERIPIRLLLRVDPSLIRTVITITRSMLAW